MRKIHGRHAVLFASALGMLACAVSTGGDTSEDVGAVQQAASGGARFGTECQRDFQNAWAPTLDNVWDHCAYFNDQLDNTDQEIFYYNLVNAKGYWETGGDEWQLDSVNLFYANTHGGTTPTDAVWAMWNQNTYAQSSAMRLGDESYGLSIFATYSCHTMQSSDGAFWTRWDSIFNGGLRIALGSHDTVYDSSTTNEVGEDFAYDITHSYQFRDAWYDAVSDWWVDNDAAVATTGADMNDCWNRQYYMNWQNYPAYPILRDGSNGWVCYSNWDNL